MTPKGTRFRLARMYSPETDGGDRPRSDGLAAVLRRRVVGWVPIYAWLISTRRTILVDTGETSRVHERGYHPRWHPFYRRASRFRVRPDDEIGPVLRAMGVAMTDIRHVVLTHLHTDHAGGLAHLVGRRIWVDSGELGGARGLRGRVKGYLPHRWPQWIDFEPVRFEPRPFGPFPERCR